MFWRIGKHFGMISDSTDSLLIFTNGSKDGPFTGSGLVIFKGNNLKEPIMTKSFSLPDYATVYNGESEIIPKCFPILQNIFKSEPFSTAHFFIDNQATLKNLSRPWETKDTTIHRIYTLVRNSSFPVSFTYIPAHSGHFGNELADLAAKAGLHLPWQPHL